MDITKNILENGIIELKIHTTMNAENFFELKMYLQNIEEKFLIIDFTDVDYIDSSGLHAIMLKYKKISKRNGAMVLFGMCEMVRRIFTMVNIDKVIKTYENRQEALEYILNKLEEATNEN